MHCTLRHLSGGSHQDIQVTACLPVSTFHYCIHRGIDAINKCLALSLQFPMTEEELRKTAIEFQAKSSFGVMDGCIGALDGWLCRIKVSTPKETSNVSSYFSGHYECHGLNIQAACDSRCRFTWLSIRSPGGTGDSKAFYGTSLDSFLKELPIGFYIVADNAYTITNSLLIPYSGNDRRYPNNDVFNFYMSQLRIKIEQAFGMMVNKWRIFKRPIEMKLSRIPHLVECAFRLQNFCINQ